jgi:hypothetical protein
MLYSLKIFIRLYVKVLLFEHLFELIPIFRVAHLYIRVEWPRDLDGAVILRSGGPLLPQVLIVQQVLLLSEEFVDVGRIVFVLTSLYGQVVPSLV